MPRQRKTSKQAEAEVSTSNNTNQTPTARRMKMALDTEKIAALYASRRQKGIYLRILAEFIASGDQGVDVKEEWPQFASKKATTLKQGFDNAKGKKESPEGADLVDVIVDGAGVFLINTALATSETELVGAEA